MNLSDYPRPRNDNGRGVHWSARVYHPSGAELDFWIDELVAMQIKWVKLLDDGDGSSVVLCRRLIAADIMPVVRLFRERPNPGRMGGREASGLTKLVAAGARYFESNNEPDLPAEWQNDHMPKNWLDIVTDNFIHDADMIIAAGGLPGVPAMGPGGKENVVQKVVDRGRKDLFEKGAWFAIHNYTLNHPLDYPDDAVNQHGAPLTQAEFDHFGPWSWDNRSMEMVNELRVRAANPGHTIEDDPNCFRGWESAGAKIHAALGFHIPVISTEGGPVVGWGDDKRYPKMIPSQQAEFQMGIMGFMQDEAPDWYFSCCTWLLAARPLGDPSPTWDQMGWYTDAWNERFGLAGRLPIVQMLKETPSRPRSGMGQGETPGPLPVPAPLPIPEPEPEPVIVPPAPPALIYHAQSRLLSPEETDNRNAIYGTVTDADGTPIQGKTLRMRWTGAAADTNFPTTVTGKDPYKPAGYYEFTHTPGVFMVEVVDAAHESQTAENLITAAMPGRGRPLCYEVNFTLAPAHTPPLPEPDPVPEPQPVPDPEPFVPLLNHYLLIQPAPAHTDLRPILLHLAQEFILARGVTVGFDPAPARHAARMTVIGSVDPALAASGVPVDQVAADPFTLQSELEALS